MEDASALVPIVHHSSSHPLAIAGQIANAAAAQGAFADYQARRAANTLRRQLGDLARFAAYLQAAGVPSGAFATDPAAWAGVSWGLVRGFVQWMLDQGDAVGSVNVRLATVKVYAKLAAQAGVITGQEYALISTVAGYRQKEARNVDATRPQTRRGPKKAQPVAISAEQVACLKDQSDTPQGRRDGLLMCLLLDHGLRCGEVAALMVTDIDLRRGTLTFYRQKVNETQTHKLTADTLRAALCYFQSDAPGIGPLLLGSRKDGRLEGTMSSRAIAERVRVLGEACGLAGLSPHDCRHAWATLAAEHGTDPFALQEGGGWSSLAMPRRYIKKAKIANQGVRLN